MIPVDKWPGLTVVGPIATGARSDVWRGQFSGHAVAIRHSKRSRDSLQWELVLLVALQCDGFTVPRPLPTLTGTLHFDGWNVQTWLGGEPPSTSKDWRLVARELQRLHVMFADHPQRPGACMLTELAEVRSSVDAHLDEIPRDVVARCLPHFEPYLNTQPCLIHGDPGPENIRITPDGQVGFLDWDEARRDVPDLDLANLGIPVLEGQRRTEAEAAAHAWEALNEWTIDVDYARRRLGQVPDA